MRNPLNYRILEALPLKPLNPKILNALEPLNPESPHSRSLALGQLTSFGQRDSPASLGARKELQGPE